MSNRAFAELFQSTCWQMLCAHILSRLLVFEHRTIAQDLHSVIQTTFPITAFTEKMPYLIVIVSCHARIRRLQFGKVLISNCSFDECFPSTCWQCLSSTFALGDRSTAQDLSTAIQTIVPCRDSSITAVTKKMPYPFAKISCF